MAKLPLILFFLIIPFLIIAQENADSTDTTTPQKPEVKPFSSSIIQAERRKEIYNGKKGHITGLKLGVELYKRFRIGYGYYDNFRSYYIPLESALPINQTMRYSYSAGFAEVVFFRNFHWELAASLAFGRGQIGITKFESSSTSGVKSFIKGVNSQDYGLKFIYKPIPWFGVFVGMGYRNTHVQGYSEYSRIYSLGYYDAGLKFFPGYLYKALFHDDKITQEELYYKWRKQKRKAYLKKLFKHD